MNHLIVFLTSSALLSGAFAQEHLADRKRGNQRKGPPRTEEFMKVYDVDKDNKVSRGEFGASERASRLDPATREKIFVRLDKDGDGFISMTELESMVPEHRKKPLAKADLDKDDRISKEEFAGHGHVTKISREKREQMFARLDHNSDGFLDRKDGRPGRRGERHLPRIKIKGLDLDRNGSLSWGEFRNAPAMLTLPEGERRHVFQKLDADKDGEISAQEIHSKFELRTGGSEKKSRLKK